MDKKKRPRRAKVKRGLIESPAKTSKDLSSVPGRLLTDVRRLIDESREGAARAVNTALIWLHWNVGKRIGHDILQDERADYGEQIVS